MSESIILGGGCFWCTESVFQAVIGVNSVTPGYCGGHTENPSYEQVCSELSGHIEVVKINFSPSVIKLDEILSIFFATHDPTTYNQQGADIGSRYASVIFYTNEAQLKVIKSAIQAVQSLVETPVVTQIRLAETFWPAEKYHHNYYKNNPNQGYCQFVIAPKLTHLRQHFAQLLS